MSSAFADGYGETGYSQRLTGAQAGEMLKQIA